MLPNAHLARVVEAASHLTDADPPWDALLQSVRQFIGGDSATFILFDPAGDLVVARQHGVDPDAEREYIQHYHAHDITTAHTQNAAQGTWFDTARMRVCGVRRGEREYLDFMQRHRMRQMVGLIAIRMPELHGGFTIQRSTVRRAAQDWSQHPDIRRFSAAIQRGLVSVYRERQDWITHAQSALEAFGDTLCLLTAQGRVLHVPPAASALLDGARGLCVRRGAIWHPHDAARRRIAATLHWVSGKQRPASLRLTLSDDTGNAWGHADLAPAPAWTGLGDPAPILMRLRPAATEHPDYFPERLAAAFGLTPAEARVLAALTQGQSVAEHARRHGSSVHTVRKQVAVLMQKMDCNRQIDAVRSAMEVARVQGHSSRH